LLLENAESRDGVAATRGDALKYGCTVLMDAMSARIVAAPEEMWKIRGRRLEVRG
jgi:hypothetical protein